MFWNYFSVGMDAASAHGFHRLREARPWATTGRLVNQAWYTYYGFATGWMFGAPPIRNKVKLWVRSWLRCMSGSMSMCHQVCVALAFRA